MRTVTVSHNWYSFLRCSGIAVLTVFGVPSDVSCQDWGRVCRAWLGLVGMKAELGHSLTITATQLTELESGVTSAPCKVALNYHLNPQRIIGVLTFHYHARLNLQIIGTIACMRGLRILWSNPILFSSFSLPVQSFPTMWVLVLAGRFYLCVHRNTCSILSHD